MADGKQKPLPSCGMAERPSGGSPHVSGQKPLDSILQSAMARVPRMRSDGPKCWMALDIAVRQPQGRTYGKGASCSTAQGQPPAAPAPQASFRTNGGLIGSPPADVSPVSRSFMKPA